MGTETLFLLKGPIQKNFCLFDILKVFIMLITIP